MSNKNTSLAYKKHLFLGVLGDNKKKSKNKEGVRIRTLKCT